MLINNRENWWAAFPAFTLLGLAASSFLPDSLEPYDSLVFFAGISLGFWWVYFTGTDRWWAIIPAGVLLTLGIVSRSIMFPASKQAGCSSSGWDSHSSWLLSCPAKKAGAPGH